MIEKKLKGWEEVEKDRLHGTKGNGDHDATTPTNYADGGFSLEGFMKRLVRWIVVDDQVRLRLFQHFNSCRSCDCMS